MDGVITIACMKTGPQMKTRPCVTQLVLTRAQVINEQQSFPYEEARKGILDLSPFSLSQSRG